MCVVEVAMHGVGGGGGAHHGLRGHVRGVLLRVYVRWSRRKGTPTRKGKLANGGDVVVMFLLILTGLLGP